MAYANSADTIATGIASGGPSYRQPSILTAVAPPLPALTVDLNPASYASNLIKAKAQSEAATASSLRRLPLPLDDEKTPYVLEYPQSQHYVVNPAAAAQTVVALNPNALMTKSCQLMEVVLPNTLYKINATNNVIDWTHGGTFSFTIPPGAYTASSLAAAIQTGMNAADANAYVWSFNADQMNITVTAGAAYTLNFLTGPNTAVSVGPILGFFPKADFASSGGTNLVTAPNVIQLFAPLSLYLRINELGNHVFVTNQTTSQGQGFTFRVPVTVESGAILEYDSNSDYPQILYMLPGTKPKPLAQLTCSLTDANGLAVNLNGASYEFVLEII